MFQWFEGLGCVYYTGYQDTWVNSVNYCGTMQATLVNYVDLQNGNAYFQQYITLHGNN